MDSSKSKSESPESAELDIAGRQCLATDVSHTIDYDHYVDSTPVGSVFGVMFSIMEQSGIGFVILGCLMVLVLILLFFKFLMSTFIIMVSAMGLVMIATAIVSRHNPIKADSEGISLPYIHLLSSNFQLDRHWTELGELHFVKDDMLSTAPNRLALKFRDGASVYFNIDGFSRASLQKLLLVVDTYRPNLPIRPSLKELDLGLSSRSASYEALDGRIERDSSHMSLAALSFTELWKKDLAGRFGSTAFVPLECGEKLQDDRFEIVGQVAFGGLSAIYLARQQNDALVVLKEFLLPDSVDNQTRDKSMELFQREAQLLSRIDHESIACVYDYFVEQDRHYIVLEYIEGKNLRSFISDEGPQNETTLLRWAKELGEILLYLHSREPAVIHRDLTPENIIVAKDGRLTVIDFGAANNFIGTATGTVVGKSAFIPLEQFQGRARPTSDIYALGATLYFLATGRDPVPFSTSDAKSSGALISIEFNDLIKAATAVKSERRIATAGEWLERLDKIIARGVW